MVFSEEFMGVLQQVVEFSWEREVWFRGHSSTEYQLVPGLFRYKNETLPPERQIAEILRTEASLYNRFRTVARRQIGDVVGFDLLMLMQHYGVPTRLLDWTASFAVAMYFATRKGLDRRPHVWALVPSDLNRVAEGDPALLAIDSMEYAVAVAQNKLGSAKATHALLPAVVTDRIVAQQGRFTSHGNAGVPLDQETFGPAGETLGATSLRRFDIPNNIQDIGNFLKLSGVSGNGVHAEFALMQDLDTLGRELRESCRTWSARPRAMSSASG